LPPPLVVIVLRLVALRAQPGRLALAEALGVAVVTLDLAVRRAEVELRPLGVVEVLLLERLERRRVTPLARLQIVEVAFVHALVAADVAAVIRLGRGSVEQRRGLALRARGGGGGAGRRPRGAVEVGVV